MCNPQMLKENRIQENQINNGHNRLEGIHQPVDGNMMPQPIQQLDPQQNLQQPIHQQIAINQNIQQQLDPQQIAEHQNIQGQAHQPAIRLQARLRSQELFAQSINEKQKSSRDMMAVKEILRDLEHYVTDLELEFKKEQDQNFGELKELLDLLETKYVTAIEKCSVYLQNKDKSRSFYDKKRYAAVKNTRALLEKELGSLPQIRNRVEANPDSYAGKKLSLKDLLLEAQDLENSASKLELKDFIKITTNKESESIVLRNGKLYKIDSETMASSNEKLATKENYQMAERFIAILLERQSISSEATKKRITRNMLYQLGANVEEKIASPVSMEKIRGLILENNTKLSKIDTALTDKKASPQEQQIANQINQLLGKSLSKKNNKSALKKQIKNIMTASDASKEWKGTKLTGKDMDLLVNGASDVVRERAFECAMQIYKNKTRFLNDPAAVAKPLTDEELKPLLGLIISEVTASNRLDEKFYGAKIQRFEENLALNGQDELKKELRTARVEEFNYFSHESVRDSILNSPDKLKLIGKTEDKKQQCLQTLSTIINNMQEIISLEQKGLEQGLGNADAALLKKKASEIDRLIAGDKKENLDSQIDNLKAVIKGFGKKTMVGTALGRLLGLYKNQGNLVQHAEKIATKLKTNKPADEEAENPALPVEVLSEYRAAKTVSESFNDKAKKVVAIFLNEKLPSELVKEPGNQMSRELMQLHDTLSGLSETEPMAELTINGTKLTFIQDKEGVLTLRSGSNEMALPYDAKYWANAIEEDLCTNFEKYDQVAAKDLVKDMIQRDSKNDSQSRVNYERFLSNQIGATPEELNNLTVYELLAYVNIYCEGTSKEKVKNAIHEYSLEKLDEIHINSQAIMESLTAMERLEKDKKEKEKNKEAKDQVKENKQKKVEFGGEEKDWPKEEKAVLNFVGDVFFNGRDQKDQYAYTADRLKDAIRNNLDGFKELVNMPDIQRKALDLRFQSFQCFSEALKAVENMVDKIKDKVQVEKDLPGLLSFIPIKMKVAATDEKIKELLDTKEMDEDLTVAASEIQTALEGVSKKMQEMMADSVKDMDEKTDEDWKELDDLTISELLEKGITGKEGEGAFNRKILSGYIVKASPADQQNMVASAFKNVPYITAADAMKMTADDKEKLVGKFIAGYIKGAGPLLHKTLQGIPISNMPLMMQEAVKDVRSNLTKIDDRIVDAQLNQIIKESEGRITRIDKLQVLGAASVGQTILVKVYENGATEGVEKVVKLLRPDVQNRMSRELKFMEDCAREVDKEAYKKNTNADAPEGYEGGMLKTYRNKVANIKKELDLRIEADNVEKGKLYEDELLHVHSMKADARTKKMTNILVLEKAPGVSVDKYISEMDTEREKITKKLDDEKAPKSSYQVLNELNTLRGELKKRQAYLVNLSQKWLEEAILKGGFFHGDLHAGNIMIDDNGVTVIDYGNAHKFEEGEQRDIVNLVLAASRMNETRFKEHLENLLSKSGKEIYKANKTMLEPIVETILKKETSQPVEKILVVFNELQKNGIEIPAGVYNFIQCFVRIWGTLEDYEKLVDKVDEDMVNTMEHKNKGEIEENPDAEIMQIITKNILYRNEKKYKGLYNAGHLKDTIDAAVNGAKVDIEPIVAASATKSVSEIGALHTESGFEEIGAILEGGGTCNRANRLIQFTMGGTGALIGMCRICYDSSYNGNKLTELMNGEIIPALEAVPGHLGSIKDAIQGGEDKLKDAKKQLEDINKKIREIEQKNVVPYEPKVQEEIEKLQRDKKDWERSEKQIIARLKLDDGLVPIIERTSQNIAEHVKKMKVRIENAGYKREDAVKDFQKLRQLGEEIVTAGLNENEKKLVLSFQKMLLITFDESDGNIFGDGVDTDVELSDEEKARRKKDEEKRKKDEAKARAELEKAAQRIYERSQGQSYRMKLIDTILDPVKLTKMGEAFKDWYADDKGQQLKIAYTAALQSKQPLNDNSPEVDALVTAIVNCITVRAEKMENIIKNKNTKDKSTDTDAMVWKLMKSHFRKAFGYMDGGGIVYLMKHKLSDREKKQRENGTKIRRTAYVAELYNSVRDNNLKKMAENLAEVSKEYGEKEKSAASPQELVELKQRLNSSINALLQAVSKLRFSDPGKKEFEELLEAYKSNQSEETLRSLLKGTDQYMRKLFENTFYTDHVADKEGKKQKSLLELAYPENLSKSEILPLSLAKNYTLDVAEELHENGKPFTLFESLKAGKNITWIK